MSARIKVGKLVIDADVVEIYTKRGEVRSTMKLREVVEDEDEEVEEEEEED